MMVKKLKKPLNLNYFFPGDELSITQKLSKKKTLLWFSPALGLNVSSGMELICLIGMALSIAAMISSCFQNKFVFFALWILYFSLYQVCETREKIDIVHSECCFVIF